MANPKKKKGGLPSNWRTVYYEQNPVVAMMSQLNMAGDPTEFGWQMSKKKTLAGVPVYKLCCNQRTMTMWYSTDEVAWIVRNSALKVRRKYHPNEVGLDKITFDVFGILSNRSNDMVISNSSNNSFVFVPVVKVKDNPFQSRSSYDKDAIAKLAYSIKEEKQRLKKTLGLINVPKGRLVYYTAAGVTHLVKSLNDIDGEWHVELIEGHRRKRSFEYLRQDDSDYHFMPIELVAVDDDAMDDLCWKENHERKALSVIEQAESLNKTIVKRAISHEDLATLRGMSRSWVTNRIGLLALPDDIKQAVHRGDLSERKAMAIMPLFKIDIDVRDKLDKEDFLAPRPLDVMKNMYTISSERLREMVAQIKRNVGILERGGVEALENEALGVSTFKHLKDTYTPSPVPADDLSVPDEESELGEIRKIEARYEGGVAPDYVGVPPSPQILPPPPISAPQPPAGGRWLDDTVETETLIDAPTPPLPPTANDLPQALPPSPPKESPPPPPPPPPSAPAKEPEVLMMLSASLSIKESGGKFGMLSLKVGDTIMFNKSVSSGDAIKAAFEEIFTLYISPALTAE